MSVDVGLRGALLAFVTVSVACGDNIVGAIPEGVDRIESVQTGDYPDGPYGGNENEVLENMSLAGFVVETPEGGVHTFPYDEEVTFQDLRELEGFTHMLLTIGAQWCKPCREEAVLIREAYPDWASRGGFVLSVIIQDTNRNSASRQTVEVWSRLTNANFSLTHDPLGFINANFDTSVLPLNIVVELETMTVRYRQVGEDPTTFNTFENLLAD